MVYLGELLGLIWEIYFGPIFGYFAGSEVTLAFKCSLWDLLGVY